jgi:hypothetical protein
MIDKRSVHARQDNAGHMASDTVLVADRARFAGMVERRFLGRRQNMAAQAFHVVVSCAMVQLLMRVMACNAREPSISITPAPAVFQTVGLKTNVGHS